MGKKELLITRYLIILNIILGMALTIKSNTSSLYIVLTLVFIINTQLRYFLFRDRFVPVFLSILLDFIIGYISYAVYSNFILPFFILAGVDTFFLVNNSSKYFLSLIGLGLLIYSGIDLPAMGLLSSVTAYIVIGLISSVIAKFIYEQIETEDLYHELRKSQDKLINTNKELEIYADSIKELTILQERNRISREIHDSVGHSLSTIIVQLGAIEKLAETDGPSASSMASNLREFSKDGLEEIRMALKELKPKEFEDYQTLIIIESLIRDFSKLTDIDVKLGFSKRKWKVDEEVSLVIYRAVQEFLSNSAKHGQPTKINIFIHFDRDILIVTMQDNGMGTDSIKPGMGLISLEERVKELGGNVKYESSKGKGFLLRIILSPVNSRKQVYYAKN